MNRNDLLSLLESIKFNAEEQGNTNKVLITLLENNVIPEYTQPSHKPTNKGNKEYIKPTIDIFPPMDNNEVKPDIKDDIKDDIKVTGKTGDAFDNTTETNSNKESSTSSNDTVKTVSSSVKGTPNLVELDIASKNGKDLYNANKESVVKTETKETETKQTETKQTETNNKISSSEYNFNRFTTNYSMGMCVISYNKTIKSLLSSSDSLNKVISGNVNAFVNDLESSIDNGKSITPKPLYVILDQSGRTVKCNAVDKQARSVGDVVQLDAKYFTGETSLYNSSNNYKNIMISKYKSRSGDEGIKHLTINGTDVVLFTKGETKCIILSNKVFNVLFSDL